MPTSEKIEEAKANIRGSVATLREATADELYFSLVQELIPEARLNTSPKPVKECCLAKFVTPVALVFLVAACAYAILRIIGFSDGLDRLPSFTAKDRVVLLGFVVALASYVATVGRELVKQVSKKEGNDQKQTKKSIFFLVQVEASLVLLGVSAIITLFFGDFLKALFTFGEDKTVYFVPDVFLVVYLAMILLWMSGLHVRVWRITGAWCLYK